MASESSLREPGHEAGPVDNLNQTEHSTADDEHPIEELDKKVPALPFAVVALSYLALLAVVCGIVAFAVWLT